MIGKTVRQLVVDIPVLPVGQEARAIVTFEVTRRAIESPTETAALRVPKRIHRDLRAFLNTSPAIETKHLKIKDAAKQAAQGKQAAWEKTEAIYDWVREKVKYVNGPLKGALKALEDGTGDCEELSSLFIALCRNHKVPARLVWMPGHCYPEFFLENDQGKGFWIPCQAAGTRAFGKIAEFRPILQKGDSFRVPEHRRKLQRYVSQYLIATAGRPTVRFIQEEVDEKETP